MLKVGKFFIVKNPCVNAMAIMKAMTLSILISMRIKINLRFECCKTP